MRSDNIQPDLALALLLNSRDILSRLPELDQEAAELEEIEAALVATPQERILDLAPAIVELLLDAEPAIQQDIDALSQRIPTRGLDSDPSMVAGLWEAIKADIGYVALLVFFLRTLGYNKIKTKLGDYEGRSIYEELRALIRPSQSESRVRKK